MYHSPYNLSGMHPVVLDYLLGVGITTWVWVVCVAIRNACRWLSFYNLQRFEMAQ
jgi:hypothetical protein